MEIETCGCVWTRTKEYGDVLMPCEVHKNGAPHAGASGGAGAIPTIIRAAKRLGLRTTVRESK